MLAGGWRPSSVACHASRQQGAASPKPASRGSSSEQASKAEVNFWNITVDVTSHHGCHILLVKTKSLCLSHTPEEKTPQGMHTRRQDAWKPLWKLPTTSAISGQVPQRVASARSRRGTPEGMLGLRVVPTQGKGARASHSHPHQSLVKGHPQWGTHFQALPALCVGT